MTKLATLRLLDGDLEKGVQVVLTIANLHPLAGDASPGSQVEHPSSSIEISGTLPPNDCLVNTIRQWTIKYKSLSSSTRIQTNGTIIDGSIDQLWSECQQLDREIRTNFNDWLNKSVTFQAIRDKWLEHLMQGEVRVLIRTANSSLLKLPWYAWDLIERNSQAEVALSTPDATPTFRAKTPTLRGRVKILAILGDSRGIDIETDRKLLEKLPDTKFCFDTEIEDASRFLVERQLKDISDRLWEQNWDIIFFAGHSETEGKQGRIYLNSSGDSLTIEDLRRGLAKAIENGLQLAIFNSCDGMGLAFELQQLQIPQVIVMREPVPDQVAHTFLTHFLSAFTQGQSLYLAVREARSRLEGLEQHFPAATGLPVIFQNPAVEPPNWQALGRRPTNKCPYLGLFAFQEEDAQFFYGREEFTTTLAGMLQEQSLVSLIGASGSGKSSVIAAGLLPILRQRPDETWRIATFRPGVNPFNALAQALFTLKASDRTALDQELTIVQLAERLQQENGALSSELEKIVGADTNCKVLLIADQFEELYTLCQHAQDREVFLAQLLKATQQPNFKLLLALRADFLVQALSYAPFTDALQQSSLMLGSMKRSELQSAITQPAALLEATFEEGLAERMIEAVSGSTSDLPLLEFALQELWTKRQQTLLTHGAYEEIGGVEAAIAQYAEHAYSKLNESEKERSRQIFLQLVRPGEDTKDTRRVATRVEIGDSNWELVTRLASDRLVVTGQDKIAKTETVELVHEALILEWGRLQEWINENRTFRLWQERLRGAIQQWEINNRDEGALLRGKPLTDAEEWFQNRSAELTAEQEFITASLELRNKEKEKSSRQRKRTTIGLAGGLVGALGLATIAGVGWWQATSGATNDRIKLLLSESKQLFELSGVTEYSRYNSNVASSKPPIYSKEQQEKGELLLKAASFKAIKAAQELKHSTGIDASTKLQVLDALRRIASTTEEPTGFSLEECEQLKRGSFSLALTSDKKTIACVNYDGTVRLWDGKTGKKTNVFRGETEWVDDVQFSPDGKMVASGTVDGTVKLWDRLTGKEIRSLTGHLSQVRSIQFSPDGQNIGAANYDGTIIIWDVATGKELKILPGHSKSKSLEVRDLVFSPNGHFLASQGRDSTIKLWEVSTGKELKTFSSEELLKSYQSAQIRFSSNSQTLIYATGEFDRQKVRFWDIAEGRESRNIPIPGKPFFSSDGKTIAVIDTKNDAIKGNTVNYDKIFSTTNIGTVSLWDTSTGQKIKTLGGFPPGEIAKINFSPDGALIAIYTYTRQTKGFGPNHGSNGKFTFFNRSGEKLKTVEQLGEPLDFNFSPDGKKIAISSLGVPPTDGYHIIFKLWDVSTGKQLKTLMDEPIKFSSIGLSAGLHSRFSPDGKTIAAVSSSGIAKFFDSSTGSELSYLNISPTQDLAPIVSADGKATIFPRTDGSLRSREHSTGKEAKMNRYDSMLVSAAHISNDDKTITTVTWRGKLQQRELATGQILKSTNLSFDKSASSLKFSSDGRKIAAARSDYTVKIWDASTGQEITTLKEYAAIKDKSNDWRDKKVYFSPNGKILAVWDGRYMFDRNKVPQLELWDISTGKAIKLPGIPSGVKSISFNPNSDELAVLNPDNTIQTWNLSTLQLVKTLKSASLDTVNSIQFSQDGELLFILNYNHLTLLDIAASKEIAFLKPPRMSVGIDYIGFSDDAKALVIQADNKFTFLNFDLDSLHKSSCNITHDYLKNNPNLSESDRRICDSI